MTPEQKLAKIAKIYDTVRKDKDGHQISSHAYYNLEGAIYDLENGRPADRVIMRTLRRVSKQLAEIGKVIDHAPGKLITK